MLLTCSHSSIDNTKVEKDKPNDDPNKHNKQTKTNLALGHLTKIGLRSLKNTYMIHLLNISSNNTSMQSHSLTGKY